MTKRHAAILLAILNQTQIPGSLSDDISEIKQELRKQFDPGELKTYGKRNIDEWLPREAE